MPDQLLPKRNICIWDVQKCGYLCDHNAGQTLCGYHQILLNRMAPTHPTRKRLDELTQQIIDAGPPPEQLQLKNL